MKQNSLQLYLQQWSQVFSLRQQCLRSLFLNTSKVAVIIKPLKLPILAKLSVELDGYSLAKSVNGGGNWDSKLSLDGKVIQAKSVLVIGHSQSNEDIQSLSDFLDNDVLSFNG